MKRHVDFKFLRLLVFLTILLSCEPIEGVYDVVLVNCGPDEITEVTLNFGTMVKRKSGLGPEIYSGYLQLNGQIPEEAVLRWNDKSGQKLERRVKVSSVLPADFGHDEIVFQIWSSNEVRIAFRPSSGSPHLQQDTWRDKVAQLDYCDSVEPVESVPSVPSVQSPVSTEESGPKKGE